MKKFSLILLLIIVLGYLFLLPSRVLFTPDNCPFCNPDVLKRQRFYTGDEVVALLSYRPITPGHCLIIPKRDVHRFEELTEEEILEVAEVIKKVNRAVQRVFGTSAYLILQKNGEEVGQTVPHVHFHYIPRKEGERSVLPFLLRFYLSALFSPMNPEKMAEQIEALKAKEV